MKVGLLGLSNPCEQSKLTEVLSYLKEDEVVVSSILEKETTGLQRADVFNQWMKEDFDVIYDVSGGDLANEALPYIDFDAYSKSNTVFCGYSDLTCIINPLSKYRPCHLFQIRNALKEEFDVSFEFKQGNKIEGIVMGGNIRCLLKLAGTPYFPDLKNKVLFLESLSGNAYRIRTFFAQLYAMGVFNDINGLLLGQFTELDQNHIEVDFYKEYFKGPVARTKDIGHSKDSKSLIIGDFICLEE